MEPKYPHIHVPLSGEDGNAFFIIGRAKSVLTRGGVPAEDVKAFVDEAMSGDYDHVLQTVMAYASVS